MRNTKKWVVAGTSVLGLAAMMTVGAGAVSGHGPVASIRLVAATTVGGVAGADQAAVVYVNANYPGTGAANVLSTAADTEAGVAVYDVSIVAPDGSTYTVVVQQSTDVVLSASLADNQVTAPPASTPPATPPPASSPPVITPPSNVPTVIAPSGSVESELGDATEVSGTGDATEVSGAGDSTQVSGTGDSSTSTNDNQNSSSSDSSVSASLNTQDGSLGLGVSSGASTSGTASSGSSGDNSGAGSTSVTGSSDGSANTSTSSDG